MSFYGRMLPSMSEYRSDVKVTIYPWSHRYSTIVGLVYVFDDDRESFLIYMAPCPGGTASVRIHQTEVTVEPGINGVRLHSFPDPETDPVLTSNPLGVIDPAQPPK